MQEDRGQPVRVHGPALRYVRKTRRRSIAELARAAGMSRPALSMVESGQRKTVRPEVFDALVTALAVEPDVLRAQALAAA